MCLLGDVPLAGGGMCLWSWLLCWAFEASVSGPVGLGAEKAQGFYLALSSDNTIFLFSLFF